MFVPVFRVGSSLISIYIRKVKVGEFAHLSIIMNDEFGTTCEFATRAGFRSYHAWRIRHPCIFQELPHRRNSVLVGISRVATNSRSCKRAVITANCNYDLAGIEDPLSVHISRVATTCEFAIRGYFMIWHE
jgi:hypothetical protein